MWSVSLILAVLALLLAIASMLGRAPLAVSVILLCIIELLRGMPR
jgi:heme/copper-type cytochrome/quinol oxidase subunit 4